MSNIRPPGVSKNNFNIFGGFLELIKRNTKNENLAKTRQEFLTILTERCV